MKERKCFQAGESKNKRREKDQKKVTAIKIELKQKQYEVNRRNGLVCGCCAWFFVLKENITEKSAIVSQREITHVVHSILCLFMLKVSFNLALRLFMIFSDC